MAKIFGQTVGRTGPTVKEQIKAIPNALINATADLLSNSDFISRTIGMNTSYDDIMFIVQALGREPISLLGKDYLFIFDHVRRNYRVGTDEGSIGFNEDPYCNKFTFYNERPTVRFANPYDDTMNLKDTWVADMYFSYTSLEANQANGILLTYSESNDGYVNNKAIPIHYANTGVRFGGTGSIKYGIPNCDLVSKTNYNFNHGKYRTLISRFHTNSEDSKTHDDITQSSNTRKYGMSHGRNLLKIKPDKSKGYDNPYCRVWTNHYQYNQLMRSIRPFGAAQTQEDLEKLEKSKKYNTVGFRTVPNKELKFDGGSVRLDKYGVLNTNGMVNIAPTAKIVDYFQEKVNSEDKTPIKKCMFSIENLAWKTDNIVMNEYDQLGLSPEQKGPLGGRIMWFPPYDITFSESVRVNWNSNQFIGRGENVYTYTNTERSGNLSFTLLIDHPSILDYWTGRDDMYPHNQGNYLKSGNTGGVDEIWNQENTLLRFFAGCEVLSAKPQEYYYKDKKAKKVEDVKEEPVKQDPPEADVTPPTFTKKVIHCVLYYPNNYSGVNDKVGGFVDPIHYLMNGVGTQKHVNDNKDAVDIPTTIKSKPLIFSGETSFNVGGYETGRNTNGISIAGHNLNPNYDDIKKSYSDTVTAQKKAQYLTNESGAQNVVRYNPADNNGKGYTLAKIIGPSALSLSAAKNPVNLTGSKHMWYRRRWYYRVDTRYEHHELSTPDSYLDNKDFGLNSEKGYKEVLNKPDVAKAFKLNMEGGNTRLISFADMFVALEGQEARELMSGLFDDNNVNAVLDIMNDPERYKITNTRFEGHASYQGYDGENKTLSDNRKNTLRSWVEKHHFPIVDGGDVDDKEEKNKTQSDRDNVDTTAKGGNSDLLTKLWRSASLIIEYDESGVVDASTAETPTVQTKENGEILTDEKTGQPLDQTNKVEIPNKTQSLSLMKQNLGTYSWSDEYFKRDLDKVGRKLDINLKKMRGLDTFQEEQEYGDLYEREKESLNADEHKGVVERYDNEGEFFKRLERDEPFLHNLITDKIKYFDPAYHSISPEGFNARLTFLHQCTRQGSTVGASDNTVNNTAYNLAFGRPPVCVLRLGDFYYTKIIINSVNIQYENPQWDLNPEGIGVMPMFAKVNLDFTFLGGSDLGGPISRLQNAVSFNYYANTGVYDNRAEMVEYEPNGSGKESKFKPFSYPDLMHNGGYSRMDGVIDGKFVANGVDSDGDGKFNDETKLMKNNTLYQGKFK